MNLGLRVSLVGVYVSSASVLVVYHMFALQGWIQRCEAALAEGRVIHAQTTSDDLSRVGAEENCRAVERGYPWVQLAAVTAALAYVTYLTLEISHGVTTLADGNIAGPIVAFDALIAVTTVGVSVRYFRSLQRMRRSLRPRQD